MAGSATGVRKAEPVSVPIDRQTIIEITVARSGSKLSREPAGLLALLGRESDARAMMQHYLSNENAPFRTIAQWQRAQVPADNPRVLAWRQKFMEGLRKAGLPE
jgi:hypothetical protein